MVMSRSSPLDGAARVSAEISSRIVGCTLTASPRRRRSPRRGAQPLGSQRNKVTIPGTGEARTGDLKHGPELSARRTLLQADVGQAVAARTRPRARCTVVLTWLRINIERMVSAGALETTQLSRLTEQIEGLVEAGGAIDKIDQLVLPLPYCQLLKIFQIFFVFTLVLAPQLGLWTPIVAAFTAIGFFGLDQVGVKIKPFGVDDNDFPLLTMGLAMCNDLDAMVRTVSRTRMEARLTSFASTESHQIQGRRRGRSRKSSTRLNSRSRYSTSLPRHVFCHKSTTSRER